MTLIGPGGSGGSIARRHRRITLSAPGAAVPDGDGGYTHTEAPLDPPAVFGYVRPATARDLERVAAGTVIAQASHVVTIPYHPGVTTQTTVTVERTPRPPGRLAVMAVLDPDERSKDLVLVCSEVIA